ncbi:EamA family transporter [Microbispora bryophytorum]|uniref:Membrane protein n=1 Tax=Microbispora bryophytorum TaxID=1460882 RepID=A0A8H9GWV9_9ACTN|nr:EamA family transporter [Microbispora bryophytorum]MBD3135581.1 EamA family transporter [Microbispora bryophytorum]TQS09761.1 EamA family transporter [Microbispora bryophytorum]GGN98394.1 membrane protein [Microbispora bryophytorum]
MRPRHLALAVALAAVWGVNFVVMQTGLKHYPPLTYAALRFLLAAFPAVLVAGGPRVPWRWVVATGASLGVAQYGLLLLGMRAGMPAGLTSLVIQVQAVFTALFATALLGERLSPRRIAGMAVAFGGLALIAAGVAAKSGAIPFGAFLLCVGAAAGWGLGNVATRKAAPPDSLRFMVWVSAVSAPPLLVLSLVTEGPSSLTSFTAEGVGAVLYTAFLSTLGGFAVWGWLLTRYDASVVAPYSLLVPVFGIASAALFTGEPISPLTVAAGALILAGLLFANTRPRTAPARKRHSLPASR